MKLNEKDKRKVMEFHDLILTGLVNGLAHSTSDGRRDDIEWVRGRLQLWESFGRTLFDFLMEYNDYSYSLKDLKEISKKGYKKDTKNSK